MALAVGVLLRSLRELLWLLARRFHSGHDDFENHRLAVRDERPLIARQCRKKGQFHPLHGHLNASQGMAAQRNLVGCEDQTELLFLPLALEFGESKLVKRQQQALFSRQFDFDRASVRIARPTFG